MKPDAVVVQTKDGEKEIPCGLLVWAGVRSHNQITSNEYLHHIEQGNKGRKVSMDLMDKFPAEQTNKRGMAIDGMLLLPYIVLV